ncbi:very short patch repair endonuclease [Pinirhizobacter soli]|uniref:very short patch repair endonuclease n=1 Tax=Pinirhizobacter soli TaxID=2786953 RepID=UPI0025463345|nr:DNA mismatch endonuclease Vsr [Pinirhizobacter soli]
MDRISKSARSANMSNVKSRDTKPEMLVRRFLHGRGLRYRLHGKGLPGSPDLVLRKHGSVVFVHGCFWHRHSGCSRATEPSSRRDFWLGKFERNVARDREAEGRLRELGWRVFVIWECELKHAASLERLADEIIGNARSTNQ